MSRDEPRTFAQRWKWVGINAGLLCFLLPLLVYQATSWYDKRQETDKHRADLMSDLVAEHDRVTEGIVRCEQFLEQLEEGAVSGDDHVLVDERRELMGYLPDDEEFHLTTADSFKSERRDGLSTPTCFAGE